MKCLQIARAAHPAGRDRYSRLACRREALDTYRSSGQGVRSLPLVPEYSSGIGCANLWRSRSQHLVMVEGEALHDDFAVLIGNDPAMGRQVG